MGIRNLGNGYKAVLSYFGKQSCMQILDESGNLVRTRLKSIKTTTLQFAKPETRQSIGFVPQTLTSHTYDRTMRPIGFNTEGQKRIKTSAPRKKTITTTKTTIENDGTITSENIQRAYTVKPERNILTGVKKLKPNDDIKQKQESQASIIAADNGFRPTIDRLQEAEQKLSSLNDDIQSYRGVQNKINETRKQLEERIKAHNEAFWYVDAHAKYWDDIKPLNTPYSKYTEGLSNFLHNLREKQQKDLTDYFMQALELEQLDLANNLKMLQVKEYLTKIKPEYEKIKKNVTELLPFKDCLSKEGQKELCQLQREITVRLERMA